MASIGTLGKIDSSDISKMLVGSSSAVRSSESIDAADSAQAATRISSTGKLQNALSQLADAARKLSQPNTWDATKALSSAPEVLDVTTQEAETDQKIEVQVDQAASAQSTVATIPTPLATPLGLGMLNIEMGQWNSSYSTFTPNPNWPKARISVGPGDSSIERLRDKINAASSGVVANVISDSTGTYLLLRASVTGQSNGFKVTAEVSPEANASQAELMRALEFNPAAVQQNSEKDQEQEDKQKAMQLTQPGLDAVLQVNGQQITSSSNFVEDIVPGVDATVKQASAQAVNVAVRPDREVAKTMVENLVNHYNDLQSQLDVTGAVEPKVVKAAIAVNDNIQDIWHSDQPRQADLRQTMENLGIQLNDNHRLSLDTNKLDQSLQEQAGIPDQLDQLARAMTPDTSYMAESPAVAGSRPGHEAEAPNTSALFRQAVLEQYTNNMYAEDIN